MKQYDVYQNPENADYAKTIPYLLVVQTDRLHLIPTTLVAPLVRRSDFGKPVQILHPVFHVNGEEVIMLSADLAVWNKNGLTEKITNLEAQQADIKRAIDLVFFGI